MKPIVIAECCQNHRGDRETLKRMIHEAAAAGADYVKIQAIRSRELVYRERFEEGRLDADGAVLVLRRPYRPEVERLAPLDLSLETEAWFVDECRIAGIRSMTTVFTRTSVRDVKDLGFDAVKIASYDCASFPLLRDVRRWWSVIFCSTGATFDNEIEAAASILAGSEFTFLHCVTIYPTPMDALHLRRMSWVRRFTPRVGFSDHTRPDSEGLWASKIALALGADCIERHFRVLDRNATKDGPVSIDPAELRDLVTFAARPRFERMQIVSRDYPRWQLTLGTATRELTPSELLNRDYYRGRFASKTSARDIDNWDDVDFDAVTG